MPLTLIAHQKRVNTRLTRRAARQLLDGRLVKDILVFLRNAGLTKARASKILRRAKRLLDDNPDWTRAHFNDLDNADDDEVVAALASIIVAEEAKLHEYRCRNALAHQG